MIGAHFGIETARVSLFFFGKGIVKKFLKTIKKKINNHNRIVSSARSKFNKTKNVVYKAQKHAEINHEKFVLFNKESKNIVNQNKILE